jgi:CheY-like chemotaxis protein
LLVDADEPARDTLRQILEEAGYTVSQVADGLATLDLLRLNLSRKRPHRLVVMVSQALPQLDGASLLRAIADDPHLATHHAYVLLTQSEGPAFHVDEPSLPNLTIAEMPQPLEPAAVVDIVARAASGLGMGSEGASRRD